MRILVIVMASKESEAGVYPSQELRVRWAGDPLRSTVTLVRRPAGGNLPKDRSVPSDRIDTGTTEPRHINPTRKRRTLAEASA